MKKDTSISLKQQQILAVIQSAIKAKGYPPSVREIGEAVGLKSPSTVHMHLNKLEQLGAIRRESEKNRAIDVVGSSTFRNAPMTMVPLVGRVTAGQPILATENIEDSYPFPADLVGQEDVFMLKVDGEEATVKRFFHEKDRVRLQPENDRMDPIYSRDVAVLGKVIGVYRKM